jgi:hypothetical protein
MAHLAISPDSVAFGRMCSSEISAYDQGLPPFLMAWSVTALHHFTAALALLLTVGSRSSDSDPGGLAGRNTEWLRSQHGKSMRDTYLVILLAQRRLPVVLHHLCKHKIGKLPTVREEDILHITLACQVGTQSLHDLARQRVKKVAMGIVVDLVAFYERRFEQAEALFVGGGPGV